jgi:hypothetical protein
VINNQLSVSHSTISLSPNHYLFTHVTIESLFTRL